MTILLSKDIVAAAAAALSDVTVCKNALPQSVVLMATFTYVADNATSVEAWVQTSFDDEVSWIDVADFKFTTSSAKKLYNLSSTTAVTTQYTGTDGALTANTSKDGLLGPKWRVKTTSIGTYGEGTSLVIDAFFNGPMLAPALIL